MIALSLFQELVAGIKKTLGRNTCPGRTIKTFSTGRGLRFTTKGPSQKTIAIETASTSEFQSTNA
jgi:hypothetical protein